ncbi:phage tail tip lysozyme [Paenibacillus sp. Dod16]|uniref:phage tail tip lysozyme n=1 Tax=Paenibacillus sp. Dod16 TaxID=3416392 RepID=UPI003CFACABD
MNPPGGGKDRGSVDRSVSINRESSAVETPNTGSDTRSKLASGVRSGSSARGRNASDNARSGHSKSKSEAGARSASNKPAGTANAAREKDGKSDRSSMSAKKGSAAGNPESTPSSKGGSSGVNSANLGSEKIENTKNSNGSEGSNGDPKAKDMNSQASGDSSDKSKKSKKDSLENQAADGVMNLIPGIAQANSARKKLNELNKGKKESGKADKGKADKAEEPSENPLKKGVKIMAGTAAGSNVAGHALFGLMLMKMLMMLKGFAMAIMSKVLGVFGAIFNAISSFIAGVLGVAAAIANVITAGVVAVSVAVVSVFGYGVAEELTLKDDSFGNCVPERTIVRSGSQDYLLDGALEVIREENAVKVWSVYERLGGSKEQTAAVLGNLQHESGLDPTGVETIYNEPFEIGPRKLSAMSAGFLVSKIDAKYAAKYPAIKYVGIGLGQWTNGRNTLLLKYAQSQGANWYDFDTQIKFMLEGDDTLRKRQLIDFLETAPSNVEKETERFMNTWIGLSSPNNSLSQRIKNSVNLMFVLERSTTDTAYADSILSSVNVGRSEGNSAVAAYYQDDGCGNPIKSHYGNQSIDGTGEVPADLVLVPWSRETLPASLQAYAKNPEDAGLVWGNATGWANGIIPDQCAALAHSYFMRLYPDWNQGGRQTERPYGDGKDVADNWAKHYDQAVSGIPAAGALFSDATTSRYGHTGIVQHVFANGDILVVEQNIRGVSGRNAPGLSYSWSWRVIKKDRYEKDHWKFFKPIDGIPQWIEPEYI